LAARTGFGLRAATGKFLDGLAAELAAAAEAEFRLTKPRDDGKTPRELGAVNELTFPAEVSYLLDVFFEIRRGAHGPITLRDIAAWAQLGDLEITKFSSDVILLLDEKFLRVQAEPIVQATKSIVGQLADIKQYEDSIRSGTRMASINPKKKP